MYGCIGHKWQANFERKFSVNLKENQNTAVDWPLVLLVLLAIGAIAGSW